MNESLSRFIGAVRHHVQRAVVAYGIAMVVCAILWSSAAWVLLDWLFRFADPVLRFAGTAGVLGVGTWAAWRRLIEPLVWFPDELAVARAVERRIPSLRERLVAAVQFALAAPQEAAAGGAACGSPALQELTVRRAVELLAPHRPEEIIDRPRVNRWVLAAVASAVACLALAVWQPRLTAIGLGRLLLPWSDIRWPRRTELILRDASGRDLTTLAQPLVWAIGERRELIVENARGALPDDVVIEFRLADGSVERRHPRSTVVFAHPEPAGGAARPQTSEPAADSAGSRARASVRRSGPAAGSQRDFEPSADAAPGDGPNVPDRSNAGERREVGVLLVTVAADWTGVRAVGGDDREGPWLNVRPEPPPEIRSVRLTVRPPEYARADEQVLPEGTLAAEVLAGGVVLIQAETSKPIRVARLTAANRVVAAELDESGRRLSARWRVVTAGVEDVTFDLRDAFGLRPVAPPRLRIAGRADRVPDVQLVRPQTDLSVTPQAVVPVRVDARDDLALREVRLAYSVDRSARGGAMPGGADGGAVPQRPGGFARRHVLQQWTEPRATAHRAELNWELRPLQLRPGDRIVFRGEADDFFDLGTSHTGVSVARTLTVVTPREKFDELVELHRILSGALGDAAEQQRSIRERAEQLTIQADRAGTLRPQDIDMLKQLETEQRELAARTVGEQDSLLRLTERILEAARDNRLQERRLVEELERVRDRLNETQPVFPRAAGALTRARKYAQEQAVADAAEALRQARAGQDEIERLLRGLTERLGRQQSELQFEGALNQLLLEQADVRDRTAAVGRRTLGRPVDALDPQQRADLEKLVRQQRELAERLTRLLDEQTAAPTDNDGHGPATQDAPKPLSGDQAPAEAPATPGSPTPVAGTNASDRGGTNHAGQVRADPPDSGSGVPPEETNRQQQRSQSLARRLQDAAVAARMEQAAGAIAKNDVLDAARRQEEVLRDLQAALEAAERKRRRDGQQEQREELIKQARQSEVALRQLSREQAALRERGAALRSRPANERRELAEELAKQQAELQRRLQQELQRLQLLRNDAAQSAAEAADRSMAEAAARLQGDDTQAATERQAEAGRQLQRAADAVARQRRQLEQQLAWEQAARLADWVEGLIARQRALREDLRLLLRQYDELKRWRRSDLRRLRELERTQSMIRGDLERVRGTVSLELYRVVLDGAGDSMERVVAELQQRLLTEQTVEAANLAVRRLEALLRALRSRETPRAGGDQGNGDHNGGRPGDRVSITAMLQLLADLQAELRERTAALEARRGEHGRLGEADRDELDRIAAEQDRLRAIALEWLPQIETLLRASRAAETADQEDAPKGSERPSDTGTQPADDVPSAPAEKTPAAPEPSKEKAAKGEQPGSERGERASEAPAAPEQPSRAEDEDSSAAAFRLLPGVARRARIAAISVEPAGPRGKPQTTPGGRPRTPAETRAEDAPRQAKPSSLDRAVLEELRGAKAGDAKQPPAPARRTDDSSGAAAKRESGKRPLPERGRSAERPHEQDSSGNAQSQALPENGTPVSEIERLRRDWEVAITRLAAGKTDEPTQAAQQDAEEQLRKLLEKLRHLPQSDRANGSPDPQQGSRAERPQKTSQQQQPGSGNATGGGAGAGGEATQAAKPGQGADQPQDAEQTLREAAERAARLLRRRRLLESIWGHLPPQVRDRILNVQQEKAPPDYADLVQRYYDALARPKGRAR